MFKSFKLTNSYRHLNSARGVAVLLMILSHVIAFLHDDSNLFLEFLRFTGDTFAFSIFLFISGCVHFITIEKSNFKFDKHKLNRILQITCIYYILVFFPYFKDGMGTVSDKFISTIFFINVPNYTEFLLPFIFYGLLLFFFPKIINIATKNIYVLIFIVLFCLGISYVVYPINMGIFNPIKALLVGSEGYYRFPIITYFPVFLFGAYIQKKKLFLNKDLILNTILLLTSVLIGLLIISNDFSRWPPTPMFMLSGVVIALVLISFEKYYRNPVIEFFGKYSLSAVLIHLLIINIIDIWIYKTYNRTIVVGGFYLLITLLTFLIIYISNVIRKNK